MKRSLFPPAAALAIVVLAAAGLLTGCQTVEATGERHLSLIGEEQEIQIGRESDAQIVGTIGLYPDEDLQEYVDSLGKQIAATTERPHLPWTFRVLDDPVVNAFALPGGFIYVTRGILTHFDNEAQLAGVLGHEIGHVTAKHSVIRLSQTTLAQLGLGIATVIEPGLQGIASLAGVGLQLLFLSYSRDDERESDVLGVRYMSNIDRNPEALIDVMEMLERVSRQEGASAIPQWLSTHPLPANRREVIAEQLAVLGVEERSFAPLDRESYLRRLDNVVFGADPREGYTREGVFYHPLLRFRYDFPSDWEVINQKEAVIGLDTERRSAIQITLSSQDSLEAAARELFDQDAVSGEGVRRATINGLPAASGLFTARTNQGLLEGRVTFIEYDDRIYQILGYSQQANWPRFAEAVRRSMLSFDELTDPAALEVEPLRLRVVRVNEPVTLSTYYERNPMPISLEELALVNQVETDAMLERGRMLKIVVGERLE